MDANVKKTLERARTIGVMLSHKGDILKLYEAKAVLEYADAKDYKLISELKDAEVDNLLNQIREPKKAGIVCDTYKMPKFLDELHKRGFPDFEVFPLTANTVTIKVQTVTGRLKEIQNMCTEIELHFKKSN